MKHLYLSIFAFLLAISLNTKAQETEALLDLTDRATFNLCTQTSIRYDHSEYEAWNFNNYGNCPCMYNYNITEPYYSDYLISPEITLKANTLYRIETSPAAYNNKKTTSLAIGVGQGDDLSKYTELKKFENLPYASKTAAEQKTIEFNVPADGKYKIYFLGEGNALYLYNTTLYEVGVSAVPAAVGNLTLMPASDGSASVTIAFTLPEKTVSGHPLSGTLKYSIYRGDNTTAIKTDKGNAGDYITYTDNDSGTGTVSYSVVVESDGNQSDSATASTFVGKETPTPVTNLSVSKSNDSFVLSWEAPEKGIHDALIDPSALTYTVSRIVDGNATIIAEACSATTFTDNYTSAELHSLQYSVTAVLNGESSEAAMTPSFTVGSLNLPFADSFANASFGKVWTAEIISGSFNWTPMAATTSHKPIVSNSYDNDGGFAFYNAWDAPRNCSARLATAPIKNIAGKSPIIEFYLYRTTGNEKIKIQVSCDDGAWTDVDGAVTTLNDGGKQGWDKVSFPIASAITDGCNTFRVALVAISNYNQNIVLDNVRIFAPADKDIEVAAPVAPASVYSGNDINLSFTLLNNSAKAVSGSDYSYELTTDYPSAIDLQAPADIPALGSYTVSLTVPLTAIEVKAADAYSFALKVNYDGDENPDNNTSETAVVGVGFVDNAAPTDAVASQLDDNSIELKWNAAGEYVKPLNVGTSFEGFESGFTGPFDGFTSIDLDNEAGASLYMTTGSAFNIVKKPTVPKGYDGDNLIGLTLKANKQQNDWLISPLLDCKKESKMNLSFLIATKKFTTSSYYYKMEILYSTDSEYDPADPAKSFTNTLQSMTSSLNYGQFIMSQTFVPISIANIPAEAKYVAIHFISKITFDSAIWIDNIRITETETNPLLGYNVYEDGVGRVNKDIISLETNTYNIPETSIIDRRYFVTAVYGNGESQPTDLTAHITADVNSISDCGLSIHTSADGIIVNGTGNATVYDLQGRIVAFAINGTPVRLAKGVYIVKAGNNARKVIVSK